MGEGGVGGLMAEGAGVGGCWWGRGGLAGGRKASGLRGEEAMKGAGGCTFGCVLEFGGFGHGWVVSG